MATTSKDSTFPFMRLSPLTSNKKMKGKCSRCGRNKEINNKMSIDIEWNLCDKCKRAVRRR